MSYPTPILNLNFANAKQLVHPAVAFSRGSTGSYSDSSGIMRYANNGVPRFDHDPLTGVCKGLLVEPAVTFSDTYSEHFNVNRSLVLTGVSGTFQVGETVTGGSGIGTVVVVSGSTLGINATNAAFSGTVTGGTSGAAGTYSSISTVWVTARAIITPNAAVAPDGTNTMDKFGEDTTADNSHRVSQSKTITAGATITCSVWLKSAERTKAKLDIRNASGLGGCSVVVDLTSGSYSDLIAETGGSAISASVVAYPGGLFHVSLTGVVNATDTTALFLIYLHNGTTTSYTGDGTSGLYIWGAKLYAGTGPTSYLPTVASGVTRAADVCSADLTKLAYNGSPLWTGYGGTLVVQVRTAPSKPTGTSVQVLAQIDDGTTSNYIRTYRNAAGNIKCSVVTGGVTQADIDLGGVADSTEVKIAFSFEANAFYAAINGGASVSDTAGTMPTGLVTRRIGCDMAGSQQWGGHIKLDQTYNRPIASSYLQALSAL